MTDGPDSSPGSSTGSSPEFETVLFSQKDGAAEIRFNRPHRLNAAVEQLYDDVLAALDAAARNSNVRAVIITGEGRAFCAGADLKEHASGSRSVAEQRAYLVKANNVCRRLREIQKPVIAAVNGYAVGAGAEMAVSADFILMKAGAEIGFPEVSIGTFPGGGVTHVLPALVGLAKARELIFLGKRINGAEAGRIGLAARVFADDDFDAGVRSFAAEIAALAPGAAALAKASLGQAADYDAALAAELDGILACMKTEDWREGVAAASEKRKPVFRGK